MAYPVPRNEFYELVDNMGGTLEKALFRVNWDELDYSEATSKQMSEEFKYRVNQYFDEYKARFPDERISRSREVALSGIPDYISAAKGVKKFKSEKLKGGVVLGISSVVSAGGILSGLLNNSYLIAGEFALLFVGMWAGFMFNLAEESPLTVYGKKYEDQIIDAYGK